MTSSEQKYELSNSSRVRPARNLELTTSSEQKYELSSSSLQTWNRWVELECASELKPKPCDRNALALVNCLLNQATTSCTNDFAFVRRPFALPTASITIYAGTKESILISVFRAQNSSSSLTNTISLFLHWKQNKSTATAHIQYSSNVVMQIFAIFNKRILFHPIFSQFLISRNLHRHEQGEKNAHRPANFGLACAR